MEGKYGLIGHGIGYSKSKEIFDIYFEESRGLSYEIIDTDSINKELLLGYNGLNVTTPYKIEVMQYLDQIDEKAAEIGSVNCILNLNGKLIGYNTDYLGFDTLINIGAKNFLLLGNGGVSKMISWYCKRHNIGLTIIGRSDSNGYKDMIYEDLEDYSKYDYIINATKFGVLPPIDYSKVPFNTKIVDLSYTNSTDLNDTVFIKEFLNRGHSEDLCEDGFGMLNRQALESYKIWGII